jgi:hypothetical protein
MKMGEEMLFVIYNGEMAMWLIIINMKAQDKVLG